MIQTQRGTGVRPAVQTNCCVHAEAYIKNDSISSSGDEMPTAPSSICCSIDETEHIHERHRMIQRLLTVAMSLVLTIAAPEALAAIDVQTKTLANGMTILVQEDASIPNIAFYTFYRVGSRNEHEGITGLSHFFEHMMFNGAKKYGKGEFDSAMDDAGGSNNASTSNDFTVYTDWAPASALELMFDLEADRIQNLAFDPAIIESERQVVYSERRLSVDNNNGGLLNELLEATAYESSPYHWPVVGWPSDIESWTINDLKEYHAMAYSPTNATVVVVGNIKAADVFRLADQYFAPIPAHAPPPPIRTKEMLQAGERRVTVHKFAQLPLLDIAYHAVEKNSHDADAFDMLGTLLSGGQSSRLYRNLVDTQMALSVRAGYSDSLLPGLFEISAQPRAGIAPEKVEAAIYAELEKLQTTPVDEHELQKAKNQQIAAYYRGIQSIERRASAIGYAQEFYGDWHEVNKTVDRINAITAADIQRVAKQYLVANQRTVATLIPDATSAAGNTEKRDGR